MRKTVIRMATFFVLLFAVLLSIYRILSFKYLDGIATWDRYNNIPKGSVDVLAVGSSHAFVNINHETLWSQYGIAAYTLGGSTQSVWSSYYFLKDALKTQKPELIILEAYGTTFDYDYDLESKAIKNTYGLKWSKNRIDSIKASVTKEEFADYFLDYARFHNRYSELSRADFYETQGTLSTDYNSFGKDWKGQYLFLKTTPLEITYDSDIDYEIQLSPKVEEYYRKTIQLAIDEKIPILILVVPYDLTKEDQGKYNRAKSIAAEYGVSFLDGNEFVSEMGLDYATAYAETAHMNIKGSSVFSSFLGEYIKTHYDISDRRGDRKYNSWDEWARISKRYEVRMELVSGSTIADMEELLFDPNYTFYISFDEDLDINDAEVGAFLSKLGILDYNFKGVCVCQNGKVVWYSDDESAEQYYVTDSNDICLRRRNGINEIIVNNQSLKPVVNGINVTVYDSMIDTVVDSFGIVNGNGGRIVR